MTKSSDEFTFQNADGQQLSGRLEQPAGRPRAFAVFAHCFTCSKNVLAAARISRQLSRHGFAVLRFDFTGLGNSEGDFANTNFSSNVEDLVAAAGALRETHEAPKLLVGHSLGGSAVIAAAPRIEELAAVVTIGAPSDPGHVIEHFGEKKSQIEQTGVGQVTLGGRTFTVKKQFLDDVTETTLADALARLKKALLIYHSPLDNVVSIDHARKLYESAKHPKSFISLDQADHLITRHADAEFIASTLAAWAERYVVGELREKKSAEQPAAGRVLVRETGSPFEQSIQAGPHTLTADEPHEAGGSDEGPTPYDLLLSALGACTSMTVRMYADRKEWPVEQIAVRLGHEKIHAEDCRDCETKEGKVDRVELELMVDGNLDAQQRERLLEIAGRCPVHRTLTGEKDIIMRLRDNFD